ncbi:ABC transporter ATP-binding protein [Actomonas aquatica]|uniref:ABC transporter ATP-binding protein n=1 Tax=Actomonas aquatica TaxID=2866162 RepID=A0ABZ1C947_9BACT|nr:ABC transporter ATP-binding protein [Opitutus sp. WL0086]WRQ87991.1 ABC transporter ATP-binding protein [Opitutus sp. WL0086]
MGAFIELQNITHRYGDQTVVTDTSLALNQGEVFSLLGPSGSGKTTLLRILGGFLTPTAGRVIVDGQDLTNVPPNRRPINTVFQNYALFPHLTVRENIGFGLTVAKRPPAEVNAEVDRMLDLIDLHEHAAKRPHQISGGQKQRVAIARALVNQPRLLLLDEPLAALDLKLRQRMLIELENIHDKVGITFLYVTHDQGEAMSLSDRVGVMSEGRLEQVGTPMEVYETPHSRFVAGFVGDTNLIDATVVPGGNGEPTLALATDELGTISHGWDGQEAHGRVFLADGEHALQPGARAVLSIRPERIALRRECPPHHHGQNTIRGVVEDLIYLGSRTHYRIKVGDRMLSVWKQHRRYLPDYKEITWNEEVFLSWYANDGYLIEEPVKEVTAAS